MFNPGYNVRVRQKTPTGRVQKQAILIDDIFSRNIQSLPSKCIQLMADKLQSRGFSVDVITTFNGDWNQVFNQLNSRANIDTLSLIFYAGHGGKSSYSKKSYLTNGYVKPECFLSSISQIPGKKIVAIESCYAGGFVDAAEKASGNDNILVLTASSKNSTHIFNPFENIFLKIVELGGKVANLFPTLSDKVFFLTKLIARDINRRTS
jgi:hypothetical protein